MKLKITFLSLVLFLTSFIFCYGQMAVYRVIVLNEGHYDYSSSTQLVPVSIGWYNPVTKVYQPFDVIDSARFATCVIVDDNSIFAAADSFIIRYNKYTYQEVSRTVLRGVRKLTLWNNQLLASRGEYLMAFPSYFEVYDKNSLSYLYSYPVSAGPQYSSEGIVIKDNKAYIAINNGFEWGNEKGFVGIADLTAQTYVSEIDLGPIGKNPEYIALKGNEIFTLNNRDYTNASISAIDLSSGTPTTYDLNITSGCGTSLLASNAVFYQQYDSLFLRQFSTVTYNDIGTVSINRNLYGMAYDTLNNLIYAGVTDFTTTGKVFIYTLAGAELDSFNVSVSPGNIAFDVRDISSVKELNNQLTVSLYPNPVSDRITIYASLQGTLHYSIYEVTGKVIRNGVLSASKNSVDVQTLSPGTYFLRITDKDHSVNNLFIKL
jgi:hypothetical protein